MDELKHSTSFSVISFIREFVGTMEKLEIRLESSPPSDVRETVRVEVAKLMERGLRSATGAVAKSATLERFDGYVMGAMITLCTRAFLLVQSRTRADSARAAESATYALDLLAMLVPKRIANEEIGDALEQVDAMVRAQRPRWFIYVKVSTTFFWVFVHTGLHYAERIAGIIGKATGGKGD